MWLIKAEEETDERYGKRPSQRSMEEHFQNSIIIVDKHAGPTSHQIVKIVKEIFRVKKAGHAGTLELGEIPK